MSEAVRRWREYVAKKQFPKSLLKHLDEKAKEKKQWLKRKK